MQRGLVIGAVIATLGSLLYLQLGPDAPSAQAASGDSRGTSPDSARQWLPWSSKPSSEEEARESSGQAGSSVEQTASASGKDEPDLPGTFSLWGYVTDENGQPIGKVAVRAKPSANSHVETQDEVETDAQGRFRLRSLAPGLYDLRFQRARFLTRKVEAWQHTAPPEPLTLQLQPAPSIQGRVVDTAGNPLHGVEVELYKLEREDTQESPSVSEELAETIEYVPADVTRLYARSTETEPDGTFILDTEEPGAWLVRTKSEGFTPVEQEVTSPAKDVQLVLGAGTWVEVTVVDEQDRPVPRANVALWREDDEEWIPVKATTNEAGYGVIQGLEPGQYGLAATPPEEEGFRLAAASLALHGEKTRQVLLRFDEGLSLSGVVVNRAGAPIPDVEVHARFRPRHKSPESPAGSLEGHTRRGVNLQDAGSVRRILSRMWRVRHNVPHRVRTGPDGRFTIPHLMPFIHRLSFEKSGYTLALPPGDGVDDEPSDRLEAFPGQDDLRVVLTYQGRVSGRVVRAADGEPIPSFQIDGEPYTRPDGTFTMTAGDPGPHTLDILVPGVGGLHVRYESREGEDVDLGDLVVGEGRPVRVRAEDAATALPIAGVYVDLVEEVPGATPVQEEWENGPRVKGIPLTQVELGLESTPETGRDGICVLPDVPSRPLVLTAGRRGYEPVSVALSPGEQEVTLRMRAWATVQGWVRAGGNPIAKGGVSFYSLEGRHVADLEVRNGWFSGHHFPPGRYFARAECDRCPKPEPVFIAQQLDVPGPQEVLSVDFQEAHGATLEIRTPPDLNDLLLVQGQHPLPAHSQEQRLLSRRRHPHEFLEGDEEGYRFRDIPPGRYTLFFSYVVNEEPGPLQREELQIPEEGLLRIQLPPR